MSNKFNNFLKVNVSPRFSWDKFFIVICCFFYLEFLALPEKMHDKSSLFYEEFYLKDYGSPKVSTGFSVLLEGLDGRFLKIESINPYGGLSHVLGKKVRVGWVDDCTEITRMIGAEKNVRCRFLYEMIHEGTYAISYESVKARFDKTAVLVKVMNVSIEFLGYLCSVLCFFKISRHRS